MKSEFVRILANLKNKKDQKLYAELTQAYSKYAGVREVYHYQLGYTPTKLVNLKYEICKKYSISEKEIALYDGSQDEEEQTADAAKVDTPKVETTKTEAPKTNPILDDMDEPAQQGLKIRDEYPFLNDENTPDEFKVLVSDKITAYKNYAALHAEALQAADEADAEEKLYELAKDAVKNYQLNQDIKSELDFYRDTKGKVLGKHPKLANLKITQEIGEMSEADLVKHRNNALKSVSKYKKAGNTDKVADWEFRLEKATGRLVNDFKHNFEK